MATVTFTSENDFEVGQDVRVEGAGSSSGNRLVVERGEVLTFDHAVHFGLGSPTWTLLATVGYFTDSSAVLIPNRGSINKTISNSATLGNIQVSLSANDSGYYNLTVYLTVVSSVDTTPDPFTISASTLNNPNVIVTSELINLTGINESVTLSANNGATVAVGSSGSFGSSRTITNGQSFRVRFTTPNSYNTATAITVTAGGTSSVWNVSTRSAPDSGEIIPFPITSGNIRRKRDVQGFFGGDGKLSSYLKGGGLVPNIAQNINVPTTLPIRLSQLRGSATSLYWETEPSSLWDSVNTIQNADTASCNWSANSSWLCGYGDIMDSLEYKFTITHTIGGGSGVDIFVSVPNAFSVLNDNLVIARDMPQGGLEFIFRGEILMEVRHKDYPQYIISSNFSYSLESYGA